MSPIIYARHRCAPAEDPDIVAMGRDEADGVMWQCPECDAYWETEVTKATNGQVLRFAWVCMGRPREQAQLREVEAAFNPTATTPTVTPHMVQLVLDTYAEHEGFVIQDGREFCAECDAPLTNGTPSLVSHAREKAAEALQGALAAGETR